MFIHAGIEGSQVVVDIHALAAENEANLELIRFMAEILRCPKTSLRLERGGQSRDKVLSVQCLEAEEIDERIKAKLK